jgi:hypothetical protein
MAHVSLRVTDQEKSWMKSYAKLHGLHLSEAIKEAFFEKLETEFDLKVIDEYESKPDEKTYSHEKVKTMLGIN